MVESYADNVVRPIRMIDITQKRDTERQALAVGRIRMKPETLSLIRQGRMDKGDVLAVAQTAGIMAAKQTYSLIPLCHPLLLTNVAVQFDITSEVDVIEITASATGIGKTGMDMEALTAVSVAALTIYDMCKGIDRAMTIDGIRLLKKSGGKSGEYIAGETHG